MKILPIIIIVFCFSVTGILQVDFQSKIPDIKLPERGLCAHRGAMGTHPENTLVAFEAAIEAGAHMIEFDVRLTRDKRMVVIHDGTVDRTTNGSGKVSDLTLSEIKKLDAGAWKSLPFAGEQIPTLEEVLQILPRNIWLNVHLKGTEELAVMVTQLLVKENRLHQAFIACGARAAAGAKEVTPEIMVCNMDRKESNWDYVNETISMKADFIQLRREITPEFAQYAKALKDRGVYVNYYGTDSPEQIKELFDYGIDFPLVNDIVHSIKVAEELNILPVTPDFGNKTK